MSSLDTTLRKEVIGSKIESILMPNHIWGGVDLPLGVKTIGCEWILKKKLKPNRPIENTR